MFKEEIGAAVGRAQAINKGPTDHQLPMHCPFPTIVPWYTTRRRRNLLRILSISERDPDIEANI